MLLSETAFGWRSFWKGRRGGGGGNVGDPTNFQGEVRSEESNDLWFEQNLDHFDSMNTETWKQVGGTKLSNFLREFYNLNSYQRYFVNDELFQSQNGPVFLMIGGEGEASAKWMHKGYMGNKWSSCN